MMVLVSPAKRRILLRRSDFIASIFLALALALAASLTLASAALLLSDSAFAADAAPGAADNAPIATKEIQGGTLVLKNGSGGRVSAPMLHTDVDIRVSGQVARAVVKQSFRNPSADWVEGIYVFPLPETAAVDHMKMRIGARVIEGEIKERAAAKKIYAEAKAEGKRAALVDQERPNMFTHSVANIGPGQEITVEIEYQQTLRYEAGSYSLRFPMVVGPRYIPGTPRMTPVSTVGTGWAKNTDQVEDAARITPPVKVVGENAKPINPVTLKVSIDAGVVIDKIESSYHAIKTRRIDAGRSEIQLDDGHYASRDFELKWRLAGDAAPRAALFTEKKSAEKQSGQTYGLLMLMPPAGEIPAKALPREVIFVIDTSGSMQGESMEQAKEALDMAVQRLSAQDRFNVIEFNSYAKALWNDARPADRDGIALASRWVQSLKAQGGTEMALALNLALNGGESPGRIRQVVFLTDGAVGNEEALFKLITAKLGDSRLFTIGIGSAPNSHFMNKAASLGRGTFTYIGKVGEVKEKMLALFAKLESPVLKGLRIEWPNGAQVESWPARIPDLYLGEPLVVSFAVNSMAGEVKVSGMRGDAPWASSLNLDSAAQGKGMGVLWARAKIAALNDSVREGASEETVKPQVLQVALEHHLVSKYTSLVAVDKTPARPADSALKTTAMPTNLPEGWVAEGVMGEQMYGELPRGATDMRFNLLFGLLLLATALVMSRRKLTLRKQWQ
ncbi:MAG: marine proteobacterial sortase target protein [Burkholderiales bacterium]